MNRRHPVQPAIADAKFAGVARRHFTVADDKFMPTSATNIIGTSAEDAILRFNTTEAATKYRAGLTGTASHRRELRCIRQALQHVPRGSHVLDLPCGTGRLLPDLQSMGFDLTAVDVSPHMIDQARVRLAACGTLLADNRLIVSSIFETPFADEAFDAVICNRLFHHFHEPDVRRAALRELRRICRGPLVVSFFNANTFLGGVFNARNRFRTRRVRDRVPISPRDMKADAAAAGLKVKALRMTRRGLSKQSYAVLVRA